MSEPEEAVKGSAGRGPLRARRIYCLIPPDPPELHELLIEHFATDPAVEVLIEKRGAERRDGRERRSGVEPPPNGKERRLANDLEGRRFGERRATIASVEEKPALPSDARSYADRVSFRKPTEPTRREHDLVRLKVVTSEWRQRCSDTARLANENLVLSRTQGIEALFAALAARDRHTWEHSAAVLWLAVGCARRMELSADAVTEVEEVALLHDIGKLGIPDSILHKPGSLSEAEWEVVRQHPKVGAQIVDSIDTLRHLAPAIRGEHERWDGRGYPDGLRGDQIPAASRITFVCDAYHTMVSDRPYRNAMSPEVARLELAENAGTQFWPEAVLALLAILDQAKIA